MTQTQTNDDDRRIGISRRDLLRRSVAGTIAVGSISYGSLRIEGGPVGNSQAIAPAIAAAGIGIAAATGWVLRETEILGSDDPPEGLTAGALEESMRQTFLTRQSTNASTFVDNQNILQQLDQAAYSEGKKAAFEAIDAQKTEADVLADAQQAAEDHVTTIMKNFLKSWNETIGEYASFIDAVEAHPELSTGLWNNSVENYEAFNYDYQLDAATATLPNGDEFAVHKVQFDYDSSGTTRTESYSVLSTSRRYGDLLAPSVAGERVKYARFGDWHSVYDSINQTHTEVQDGLATWVEGVYGEAQSGDIDAAELLSSRDLANMSSEEEGFAQAQADLRALNIPTDIEREAEVYFPNLDTTLFGKLAYAGDGELSVGEIDPTGKEPIYLTYDLAQGSGLWTEYEQGLDGGVLTLTREPPSGYAFEIVTTADETAMVSAGDFQFDDAGNWTVDLSDQLDDTIVDFELFLTTKDLKTQYETTQLDEPFEIVTFRDESGDKYQSVSFEQSEPHTDDNYISQEEWDEQRKRQQELIKEYEEAQSNSNPIGLGGSGGGLIAAGAAVVGAWFVFGGG